MPLDGSVGFVWDNEGPPSAPQQVEEFLAATEPVSIADFYVFAIAERGYKNPSFWQEEDWLHMSKSGQVCLPSSLRVPFIRSLLCTLHLRIFVIHCRESWPSRAVLQQMHRQSQICMLACSPTARPFLAIPEACLIASTGHASDLVEDRQRPCRGALAEGQRAVEGRRRRAGAVQPGGGPGVLRVARQRGAGHDRGGVPAHRRRQAGLQVSPLVQFEITIVPLYPLRFGGVTRIYCLGSPRKHEEPHVPGSLPAL